MFSFPRPNQPRRWHRKNKVTLKPAVLVGCVLAIVGSFFIWHSFAANANLTGDLNSDNKVNITDLSLLLSTFGKPSTAYDLTNDGKVTLADLSILLSNYGKSRIPNPTPNPIPTPLPSPTPFPTPTPTPTPGTGSSGTSKQVQVTFYGSYDNDPKGSLAIAHPVIHQTAGGVGTYADPLTFASPAGNGQYPFGQIIYVPSVQKYFIREDECAVSWTAPNGCGAVTMVDLYVGNSSSSQSVVNCEDSLTIDGTSTIIVNPDPNRVVDPKPIWNQSTGTCTKLH
jgi:hypothetical protein